MSNNGVSLLATEQAYAANKLISLFYKDKQDWRLQSKCNDKKWSLRKQVY